MLSSIHLGNTFTTYKPTVVPKTTVSLKPINHPIGNANYVAMADPDTTKRISIGDYIFKNVENDSLLLNPYDDQDDKKKENPFSLKGDNVNTFYIGSITVLGLFILYRIMVKSP